MKFTYNIHEAKTHLSRLVEEVAAGEEIIIAKAGKPLARLVPYAKNTKREPGRYKDDIEIPKAFFEELPEDTLKSWEGTKE